MLQSFLYELSGSEYHVSTSSSITLCSAIFTDLCKNLPTMSSELISHQLSHCDKNTLAQVNLVVIADIRMPIQFQDSL